MAEDILKRIANQNPKSRIPIPIKEAKSLEESLSLIELRCLDLSTVQCQNDQSNEGIEFREYCSLAFDIRRALPLGYTDSARVENAVKLAAVGVSGGRLIETQRYFNENDWPIPEANADDVVWPNLVLFQVADAFLRVVRNNSLSDLHAVANAITMLRDNQRIYENEYLQQSNGIKQTVTFELVALYHLAKAIEMLGIFVGNGKPRPALSEIEFHFSRAIKAADHVGIVWLALLLRWINMAARALVRSNI